MKLKTIIFILFVSLTTSLSLNGDNIHEIISFCDRIEEFDSQNGNPFSEESVITPEVKEQCQNKRSEMEQFFLGKVQEVIKNLNFFTVEKIIEFCNKSKITALSDSQINVGYDVAIDYYASEHGELVSVLTPAVKTFYSDCDFIFKQIEEFNELKDDFLITNGSHQFEFLNEIHSKLLTDAILLENIFKGNALEECHKAIENIDEMDPDDIILAIENLSRNNNSSNNNTTNNVNSNQNNTFDDIAKEDLEEKESVEEEKETVETSAEDAVISEEANSEENDEELKGERKLEELKEAEEAEEVGEIKDIDEVVEEIIKDFGESLNRASNSSNKTSNDTHSNKKESSKDNLDSKDSSGKEDPAKKDLEMEVAEDDEQ